MLGPNYILAPEILDVLCEHITPINHRCLSDGE